MIGFLRSLQSEFYKSRKTLGFWCAIVLPFLICTLVSWGTYTHANKLAPLSPLFQWLAFAGSIINVMGILLLPFYIIFVSYSVNNIEHKADTWKTLFSLPLPKWSVYTAKYIYTVLLVALCLSLFYGFTIAAGNILGYLKPEFKFRDGSIAGELSRLYLKLFINSLGIISIQFLLSLLWSDFLKPMGLGFVLVVSAAIGAAANWTYLYLFPYAHPILAISGMIRRSKANFNPHITIVYFTRETYAGLICAAIVFVLGFFIVQKKSVK